MKHLVLLGAGRAHLHLLKHHAELSRHGVLPPRITLLAPQARPVQPGMLAGYVAGRYALEQCSIALDALVGATPVRWLTPPVRSLDAAAGRFTLDDGSELDYDWLSVDLSAVQDRQLAETTMPGARAHGLFVRPLEHFCGLWPRVVELAQTRNLRLTVVGGGSTGIELALALRQRLRQAPVSLVTGARGLAPGQPAALRGKAAALLRARGVTVLPDRVNAIAPDELKLESGARLACDVALMATPTQAPSWLQASGLALDAQARLAVDACLRSQSHRNVFACGETCGGAPGTGQGRYGRSNGPTLLHNLGAALAGREPRPLKTVRHELHLLSASQGTALARWGGLCVQGRWVDWAKDRLDRPG